jgi:hypothetical protein
MLADPEEVDADLIGQDALLDNVPDRLGVRLRAIVLAVGPIAERVEPQDQGKLLGHAVSMTTARPPRIRRWSVVAAGECSDFAYRFNTEIVSRRRTRNPSLSYGWIAIVLVMTERSRRACGA